MPTCLGRGAARLRAQLVTYHHTCPQGQPGGRWTLLDGGWGYRYEPGQGQRRPCPQGPTPEQPSKAQPTLPNSSCPSILVLPAGGGRGWLQILTALPPANRPGHPMGHPARKLSSLRVGGAETLSWAEGKRLEFQKPQCPAKETSAPPDGI